MRGEHAGSIDTGMMTNYHAHMQAHMHAHMRYDFDSLIDRRGTGSVKWGYLFEGDSYIEKEEWQTLHGVSEVLPMWVADMDFPAPQPVIDAITDRARHGIFGYTFPEQSYFDAVRGWMQRRHQWNIADEWICPTPGIVPALTMLVRTFCTPGKKVIVQPPVYYPFFSAVRNNGGTLLTNPLRCENRRYSMDMEDLQAKVKDPDVAMLILCNPHNPVGRVWTREELVRLGAVCLEHEVLIVSDEIHGDLVFGDTPFVPFAGISEEFSQASIICTAPSKTFNLAGLHVSNLIIENKKLRIPFEKTMRSSGLFGIGVFGSTALEAGYNQGEEWLDQVIAYIGDNYSFLEEYIRNHLPAITVCPLEGTYLAWLDCRELGLEKGELTRLFRYQAGVYCNDGFIFGEEGEGFQRLNLACPRSILVKALDRIRDALT